MVVLKNPAGLGYVPMPVNMAAYEALKYYAGERNTNGTQGLIDSKRVINVDCGTRAQVMGGDGGFIYRLLILDGDYKGKTLLAQGDWFEEAK